MLEVVELIGAGVDSDNKTAFKVCNIREEKF
jgi:hypothetical protein